MTSLKHQEVQITNDFVLKVKGALLFENSMIRGSGFA